MKKYRMFAAVLLPIVALCLWTSSHAFLKIFGTRIVLPIEGFDPRDLLSGHYLRFRINYGPNFQCTTGGETCVCLAPDAHGQWQATGNHQGCYAMSDHCDTYMRGWCDGTRFETGIERYYFAEQHVKHLAVVPPNATAILRVGKGGRAVVDTLQVDGKSIEAFLDTKQ